MTEVNSSERSIWEDFNEDQRFADLRSIRTLHSEPMTQLRRDFKAFREGKNALTANTVPVLRFNLLRMMQIQYAMNTACDVLPSDFEAVKIRILKDFETHNEAAYVAQMNTWLQLIESCSPAA